MNPIQVPRDGGKRMNVLGTLLIVRIHGCDTNGVLSVVESHDLPGGGPPPHIHHREDETLQVFEGNQEFMVDGKTTLPGRAQRCLRRAAFRTPAAAPTPPEASSPLS